MQYTVCSWCFFLFFCLLFSCCVKSTFLSTSTYDVFIFLAFFVIYLSITAAFQPLQVFSWTTEISPLYCSLLSLCPRRFSLTISSPSVYTTASRGNLILLQFALFMSVFPCLPFPLSLPHMPLVWPIIATSPVLLRSRPENPSNSLLSSLHLHLPQEEKGNYHPLHERAHDCARNGASPTTNPYRDACLARNSDLKPE